MLLPRIESRDNQLLSERLADFASFLVERGHLDRADSILTMCENYQHRQFPDARLTHACTASARGAFLAAKGKLDAAKSTLVSSYRRIRHRYGLRSRQYIQALRRMVDLYERRGKEAKADAYRTKLTRATTPDLSKVGSNKRFAIVPVSTSTTDVMRLPATGALRRPQAGLKR